MVAVQVLVELKNNIHVHESTGYVYVIQSPDINRFSKSYWHAFLFQEIILLSL